MGQIVRAAQKFSKGVIAGLTVVSLIVLVISGLIYSSISQLVASSAWVAHSYQVIDTLDLTESYFIDAQSSERGFVATCKQVLISPFRRDIPRIFAEIALLRTLTADNRVQQERLNTLERALNDELARMTDVIAVTLKGDVGTADGMLIDEKNTRATRKVLDLIHAMETDERRLLALRLGEVRTFALLTLGASVAGTLACFGILASVFWLIRRQSRHRAQSQTTLRESNSRLEGSLSELKAYNASARAISVLAELLQTCRTINEALEIGAQHVGALLPASMGAIGLFDAAHENVEVIQTFGSATWFALTFRPDDCWGLRRGRAHLQIAQGVEPQCAHFEGTGGTTICLPLIAQGESLGVVSVRTAQLTDIQRQTLQTMTEQLALAIANLKLQETLRFQSLRDPLTGLFNRRYLDDALAREFARGRRHDHPVSIVMIDIDHFKRFNDTYGHEGGDALLAAFGKLLADQARGEDLACRYGGEEFTLILPNAPIESALQRADELRRTVKGLQVYLHGQPLGPVTMSAGVASFPAHGTAESTVLAAADRMLYRAKASGRDRVLAADTSRSNSVDIAEAG
jgi:diguanylate cyclase (GGDEF)-like protein